MSKFEPGTLVVRMISAFFAVAITFGTAEAISYAMLQNGLNIEHAVTMAKRHAEAPKANKG